MKPIWHEKFSPTYTKENGLIVLHDQDIPKPDHVTFNPNVRSNVILPPGARAGDHVHSVRYELFVGFGNGIELLIEDPKTKKITIFNMEPSRNNSQCVAFLVEPGTPHAIRNTSDAPAYVIEFASHPQERKDYKIAIE